MEGKNKPDPSDTQPSSASVLAVKEPIPYTGSYHCSKFRLGSFNVEFKDNDARMIRRHRYCRASHVIVDIVFVPCQ